MRRCVMALALLAALLLSGCAAQYTNSEFVGSWQAVKGAMGGVEVKLEDIDSHFALTLQDSGKAVLEIGENEQDGKWSPLEDTVRRLLEVQAMLAEGMSQSAIRAEIKRHEFYVKKLTAQARRLSSDALAHLYCYLVDCDVKSKRTARLDMDAFVEEVIINCCATIAVRGRRMVR